MMCPMTFSSESGSQQCSKVQCAWWVTLFNNKGKMTSMCAVAALAMKAPAHIQV